MTEGMLTNRFHQLIADTFCDKVRGFSINLEFVIMYFLLSIATRVRSPQVQGHHSMGVPLVREGN